MLHTLKGLQAFDTTAAFTGNPKSLARFALSILMLNLLPFLYFSVILLYLLHYLRIDIFSILLVFALSISIFGFDKVFHAILIKSRKKLYTEFELESVINYNEGMSRKFASHYLQSLIPGLLYILVPLGLLLGAFDVLSGVILVSCSIIGSFIVWYRWRHPSIRQTAQGASE